MPILGSASIYVNRMDNQLLAPRIRLLHYRCNTIHSHCTYIVPYKNICMMCHLLSYFFVNVILSLMPMQ